MGYLLFVGPAVILSLWASYKVKSTFSKYSRVASARGITGAQAARALLDANGLSHVTIQESQGFLSDHYHPVKKYLALSPDVYRSPSVAAIGVACHEAGHAIQHHAGYFPVVIRSALVPVASFGSNLWWIPVMLGFMMNALNLVYLGLALFTGIVLFQVVTLPVEFDASARAKRGMLELGFLGPEEAPGANRVLNAAALTYVAAALSSIMTLLYYLMRAGVIGGRR